jgi:formate-dependent nitrite reductase membrane component NrfD
MPLMYAAQPWDWWIALVLFVAGVAAVIALVVGYLMKVVAPQYPRRGQQRQK